MRGHALIRTFNGYHGLLALYWVLRALFGGGWWWLALLHTFALVLFLPLIITLPIALLMRRWRTALIAACLMLVGIAKVMPYPLRRMALADGTPLRVITFNVEGSNENLTTIADWLLVQDADIIILQEVMAEDYEPALRTVYEAYPHHDYIQGSVRIWSRYPMPQSDWVWVETPGEHHGRLALRTVLDVAGQAVTLYGVHLSLPWGAKLNLPIETNNFFLNVFLRYDETRRDAQIDNLLERVEREETPVIIAGDFNLSHTSLAYDRIRAFGLVDAARSVGFPAMTWPSFAPLPFLRLDYVWHSDGFSTKGAQIGDALGSDHHPVIVDLILRQTSP